MYAYINAPKPIDINVSLNLRSLRKERELTQENLAVLCGVSKNTISSLECCEFLPSLGLVVALCVALDCSFSQLVDCYDCIEEENIVL